MNHEPVHKIIESWQNDYEFKFESEIFWTVYNLDGFEKSVGNQLYNISCFFIGLRCGIIDSVKIAHAICYICIIPPRRSGPDLSGR